MNAAFTLDNPLRLADQWSLSAARNNDFSPHHRSRSLNGVTLPTAMAVQLPVRLERFFPAGAVQRRGTAIRATTRPSVWAPTTRCCGMANASWPSISGWRGAPENKLAGNGWASAARRSASPAGPQLQCGCGRRL
ncbi:ShlB/FhaC/HecB family hemolysin secretion/activation protein [Serratia ureilytica]